MKDDDLLKEIREINLQYLILAQNMLRKDKDMAIVRLGISPESGDLLEDLSAQQLLKLAASSTMLIRFRIDDSATMELLTHANKSAALNQLHIPILLSADDNEN